MLYVPSTGLNPLSHLILKATVGRNFLHLQVRNPTFR